MERADVQPAAGEEAVPGQGAAGGRVACARCRGDLSRVPATARFCPKCGAALGAEAVDRADVLRQMEVGLGPRRDAHAHSAMIDGYAAALYQLGQRYEVGVGPNSAEAVRCYLKAARLGNLPALGRLAAACVERERPAEVDGVEPESRGEKTPA